MIGYLEQIFSEASHRLNEPNLLLIKGFKQFSLLRKVVACTHSFDRTIQYE
jgi:hypothetical protein